MAFVKHFSPFDGRRASSSNHKKPWYLYLSEHIILLTALVFVLPSDNHSVNAVGLLSNLKHSYIWKKDIVQYLANTFDGFILLWVCLRSLKFCFVVVSLHTDLISLFGTHRHFVTALMLQKLSMGRQ